MMIGRISLVGGEVGMVTWTVSERDRAIPQTSKPGPTLAVVAGTWILYCLDMAMRE